MSIPYDCISEIFKYCSHKDLIRWRRVSRKIKDIIDKIPTKNINFYEACEKGYYLAIKKIKKRKYCLNTALYRASKGGNIDIMKLLISYGANNFNYALEGACRGEKVEAARFLLSYNVNDLFRSIYYACRSGNLELIKLLISKGIKHWDQALYGACKNGNIENVKYLLQYAKNPSYNEMFCYACKSNLELAKFLYTNYPCNYNLNCALFYACKYGKIEIVNYLLDLGADNVDYALKGACKGGKIEIAKMMVNLGATDFNDALSYACKCGDLETVNYIISLGGNDWESGLFSACQYGHGEIVKLMLTKNISEDCLEFCAYNASDNDEITEILKPYVK
ncbi:MAG: ankyrin repeat domain-containing protein [Candidatus Micrarchaeaceae archaeon]